MKIIALFACVALVGCNTTSCRPSTVFNANVSPICLVECKIDVSLITDDPNSVLVAAKDAVKKCDDRRQACADALARSQKANAIAH